MQYYVAYKYGLLLKLILCVCFNYSDTTFSSRAILDQDKEFRKFRDQSFADYQDATGEGIL